MKQNYLHDQRGVAMLLELVLVAAVLGLVGVAVYQSNHRLAPAASVASQPTTAASAAGLASAAAAIAVQDSAADAALSASADATAGEVTSADDDVANLGGALDENAF
jgi:hypothetical protein